MSTPALTDVVLYRITVSSPPTLDDFLSAKANGLQLIDPSDEQRTAYDGISVYDHLATTRRKARRYPWKGEGFIATLQFPAGTFRVVKMFGNHHHTLWGTPHAILECVTNVQPIRLE